MSEVQKIIGSMILKLRKEQGLSQQALADAAGCSKSYICQLERTSQGDRLKRPSVHKVSGLASALGVTVARLCGDDTNDEEAEYVSSMFRGLDKRGRLIVRECLEAACKTV